VLDLALVQEALAGGCSARERLAERLTFVSDVLAAQNRRFGRPLDAEEVRDLAQDTIVVIWSTQILRNNLRRKGRHFRAEKRREPEGGGVSPQREQVAEDVPDDTAVAAEDLRLVTRALDRLPEKQRQVLIWRLLENRDYDDIAGHLNTSPANARSLVFRSRAALSLEVRRLRREHA
jgi:hypothetical protein